MPIPVVLLVEDEALVRIVVADFLSEQGFEVIEAENAEKALAVLNRRSDIALLFTDVNMPGSLDGLALAREVHVYWPHVLLMITSGRRPPLTLIPPTGEFIPKPYDFDQLAELIQRLMAR